MSDTKRLFLIDGTALAYRSFFAFIRNPLITSKGEDTSATFGFTRTLLDLQKAHRPDYLAVAFDPGGKTFRHEQFSEYKATRERMPEEIQSQMVRIREVLDAFQVPVLEKPGFEADDVIGTLVRQATEEAWDVVILTGDKDFMQLVGSQVRLLNLRGGTGADAELIDEAGVKEKFGVEPARVIDVLGLMGDTSDNVPGVPKVGEKTAKGLVLEHGDLEAVLQAAVEGPQKKVVDKNLVAFADQARLSKDLVTIRTDVPLGLNLDALEVRAPDLDRVADLFRELEFNKLLEDLMGDRPSDTQEAVDYRVVTDGAELEELVERIREAGCFAVDLETTSVHQMQAEIVGIALAVVEQEGFYVPVRHQEGPDMGLETALEVLGPVLEDEQVGKVGQNLKYDAVVFKRVGIDLKGIMFDTMLASYLINPSGREHSLDAISMTYLNHKTTSIEELIGKGQKQIGFGDVPVEDARNYACEDADLTLRLKEVMAPKLEELAMKQLFEEVEIPLVSVLAEMEFAGMSIDVPYLEEMSVDLHKVMDVLVGDIYDLAGEEFNVNSPRQLGNILFGKLGLTPGRKIKTGYSTDQLVLERLAHEHPLPGRLLDYRELMKLQSTYVDVLPKLVHPETGRIHASFNQAVAATGRLSVSNPNLQNIPVRTELGRQIRRAFVPGDTGWVMLSADYSQIELRIMAHLAGDEALMTAFESGEDIHRHTASMVFNLLPDFVTDEMRDRAKTVNFGVIYGMGPFGLASRLGLSMAEARDFIHRYFETYPAVKAYTERVVKEARDQGYVTTLLGRRRSLPEIVSTNRQRREFAERTAVNTPVQGTASDMIKVAMIRVAERMKAEGLKANLVLQVHDELVFDVPEEEVNAVRELATEEMVNALVLSVPIDVEVGVGKNWLEAH